MELDINPEWVQLDVAGRPGGPLTAEIPRPAPPGHPVPHRLDPRLHRGPGPARRPQATSPDAPASGRRGQRAAIARRGQLGQRVKDEAGQVERLGGRRVLRAGDRDDREAGRRRRAQAVGGVLDGGARRRAGRRGARSPPGRRPGPACRGGPLRLTRPRRTRGAAPRRRAPPRSATCGAELATASGQRADSSRTASTAPGSSGRWAWYSAAIAAMTCSATCGGGSRTPKSSLMYADHSAVDMPIIRSWASSAHRPPWAATNFRRTRSQTGSESMSTPSMSNTTASITPTPRTAR